ncbi:MAG: Phosphoesterase- protein [Fibrobacteres bacterium]|nr:Phosphoesterase- protein [Fibrobacterota bacterium]
MDSTVPFRRRAGSASESIRFRTALAAIAFASGLCRPAMAASGGVGTIRAAAAADYSLTVEPTTVVAGGAVTVAWTAPAGSPAKDWIAAYQDGDSGKAYKTFIYTNGATAGTWRTTGWGAAGHSFRFRYLYDDGYLQKAVSKSVTATAIAPACPEAGRTTSAIKHLIVIVQENKSFDAYFGNYCTAPVGSNPFCTTGPACCEKAPATLQGTARTLLTDQENAAFDPNHSMACEVSEINGGLMDRFVSGASCGGNPRNFAVSDRPTVGGYWDYAARYAMGDRYFQSAAGASSMNDMYLARGAYVFTDNSAVPDGPGKECADPASIRDFTEPTIGDLLDGCKVDWAWYGEGLNVKLTDHDTSHCYPQYYDPSDNPFLYYPAFRARQGANRDFSRFASDVAAGELPPVAYIKPLGIRTEHGGTLISAGVAFVKGVVDAVQASSRYKDNTLILLTYDESGGYYDHVAPPPVSAVDGIPYGPRHPFLAIGPFAAANTVSHVRLEHASIIRFIEWNWLGGATGQLRTRDAVVNNIGSLLDSAKTGTKVPWDEKPTAAVGKIGPAPRWPARKAAAGRDPAWWLGRKMAVPIR